MKTLLVPIDLSNASAAVVRYAAAWSVHYDYERVILLKTFYDNVFSNILLTGGYGTVSSGSIDDHREEAEQQLKQLAQELIEIAGPQMKVTVALSDEPLLRAVMGLIQHEEPEMVLLSGDEQGEGLIARNIISIAKASPVRVMVIPNGYEYTEVDNVLVPVDFNALHAVDKLNRLKISPRWAATNLMVLNVDPEQRHLQPDEQMKEDEQHLHHYLQNFKHELYYTSDADVIEGVTGFAAGHHANLIVALPGKHSFLYTLTHKSISTAITRAASIPVMILK